MSKAVLILEIPDRCGHCRLSAMVKYYAMCMVTGLECVENGRPSWCPLKEAGVTRKRSTKVDPDGNTWETTIEEIIEYSEEVEIDE